MERRRHCNYMLIYNVRSRWAVTATLLLQTQQIRHFTIPNWQTTAQSRFKTLLIGHLRGDQLWIWTVYLYGPMLNNISTVHLAGDEGCRWSENRIRRENQVEVKSSQLSQSALLDSSSPLSSSSESVATFFILIMAALMLLCKSPSLVFGALVRTAATCREPRKKDSQTSWS